MTTYAGTYRDTWDRRIARWVDGTAPDLGVGALRAALHGGGLDTSAMPEPYLGDPSDPGLAVVLSLNPGEAGTAQRAGGLSHEAVRRSGYASVYGRRAVAEGEPAHGTHAWVAKRRAPWPSRLVGAGSHAAASILHMDLVPWHTKRWPGVTWTDAARAWAWEEVLRPAGCLAGATALSRRCGRPVVLAVGRPYDELLSASASSHGVSVTRADASGARHFALHRVPAGAKDVGFDVLVTWAKGTNDAPAASHDTTARALLGIATR